LAALVTVFHGRPYREDHDIVRDVMAALHGEVSDRSVR